MDMLEIKLEELEKYGNKLDKIFHFWAPRVFHLGIIDLIAYISFHVFHDEDPIWTC